MKDTIVIYHGPDCLDGMGAAYAAWRKFGDSADYIPAQYGQEPPDVTGKQVYILDFSYKRDVLLEMADKAATIQVLDHHKTAQADLEGLPFAHFDMYKSGCVLAWEHFHCSYPSRTLLHIQDRDLWQFKLPSTKEFCAGLRAKTKDFRYLESYSVESLVETGATLLAEFDSDVRNLFNRKHYVNIGAVVGLAVNATSKYASELGNKLAVESGTFGLVYSYDGNRHEWQYSLRSTDTGVDVSEIAKQYGGGGHRNAAGFATGVLIV